MTISTQTGIFLKPPALTTGIVAARDPSAALISIPFEPLAIYVWSVGRLANATFETHRNFCHGVATSASKQGCHASNGREGGVGGVTGNSGYSHDAQIMAFMDNDIFGPHVCSTAEFSSFDDLGGGNWGFSLNWTLNEAFRAPSGEVRIHYWVIGGDSITDATVKSWNTGEVIGSYPITGVGFQSDFMLGVGGPQAPNGFSNGATATLHVANCRLEQWCVTNAENTFSVEPAFPIISLREQHEDLISITRGFLGGIDGYARLTSIDGDGWTTAVDATAGGSVRWFTLAMKGVGSKIGAVNKRTTGTGQQTIDLSPMGNASAILIASDQNVTSATVEDIARIGVGIYDGTNAGAVAAISPTSTLTGYGGIDYNNRAFVKINNLSGTVDALASGVSVSGSSAVLDWTTNDAVATELLFCAIGDDGAGKCGSDIFAGCWVDTQMVPVFA